MTEKVLSTFNNKDESENLYLDKIQASTDSDYQNMYDMDNDVVRDWVPGKNLFFEIHLNQWPSNYKPVINWYCSQTHMRGLIDNFDSSKKTLHGLIRGNLVRGKVELKLQLLDGEGYIIDQPDRRVIILEGNLSYFPVTILEMQEKLQGTVCYLDMSQNADPEEIFSISTCRAVINSESKLFNNETSDFMDYMPVKGLYLYEIWRQMIEGCLSNDSFAEFLFLENENEEIKLGHVWTNVLQKVFKGMTLREIRNLRENNYGQFSSYIQSEILKNISGI